VYEGASTAHFADAYEDGDYVLFHSDRRADAVLLDALIDDAERQTLVPKLVEELLTRRRGGRWANTQENVFVLLALDHYFQAYEKATPEFVARAWLGADFIADRQFKDRTLESQQVV